MKFQNCIVVCILYVIFFLIVVIDKFLDILIIKVIFNLNIRDGVCVGVVVCNIFGVEDGDDVVVCCDVDVIEVCDIVCCVDVVGICVVVEIEDGGVVEVVFVFRVVIVVL